ncbi:MAG: hypothetical protein L0Z62_01635 [Gemmataceae bacterium]|nr:hypothetical protein [Gemmataceae bacterium]
MTRRPATSLFGCPELPGATPILVGRVESHVTVQVGPWALYLAVDAAGRFPQVERALPSAKAAGTRWHLDARDAAFLRGALPRLPGRDDEHRPVTVALGEEVVVRARSAGRDDATEVVLAHSPARDRRCDWPATGVTWPAPWSWASPRSTSPARARPAPAPSPRAPPHRREAWVR